MRRSRRSGYNDPMLRGRTGQRIAALLALTVWVGFAGGAEAGEILSQALGFHRNCHMACCRKRPHTGAEATPHHVSHHSASESRAPASPFSLDVSLTCGGRCALQIGPNGEDGLLTRTGSPSITTSSGKVPSIEGLVFPKQVIVSSFPARAPPV